MHKHSVRDRESQERGDVTRPTVIIYGVRDDAQANELYSIIKCLTVDHQDYRTALDIIVISSPQLLRHIAKGGIAVMEHVYTLAVSEGGSIIYSGNPPALPPFYQVSRHGA
jgi:hypothetical protein